MTRMYFIHVFLVPFYLFCIQIMLARFKAFIGFRHNTYPTVCPGPPSPSSSFDLSL